MELIKDNKYKDLVLKYRALIDEMTTDSPNEVQIKKLMNEAGLEYIKDPIERLNFMLKVLHEPNLSN